MSTVYLYTKNNCKLCEEAELLLELLQNSYDFQIEKRDIETNGTWFEKYHIIVPVIKVKDQILNCNMIDLEQIENALKNA